MLLSARTTAFHLSRIFNKFDVTSRTGMFAGGAGGQAGVTGLAAGGGG
jgi:DNA-binding CsgD family transcriptional regulator